MKAWKMVCLIIVEWEAENQGRKIDRSSFSHSPRLHCGKKPAGLDDVKSFQFSFSEKFSELGYNLQLMMWDGKLLTSLSFLFQSVYFWGWLLLFQWKSHTATSTHSVEWCYMCKKINRFEIHWLGASVYQDYLLSELRKIPAAVVRALIPVCVPSCSAGWHMP